MRRRILSVIALLTVSAPCCAKPNDPTTPTLASAEEPNVAAVSKVRGGYFGRDWWACARAGEVLLGSHPASTALKAWTIACASRAGEDALPLAEAMLAETPGDPWGLFARASALIDDPRRGPNEGIPAARAAAQALAHPDAKWLLGRALVVHGTREEATGFLAAQPGRESSPELLALELVLLSPAMENVENQVLTIAGQVRALDPTFVDGWFLPATWLLEQGRPTEAEPLLSRALELSPYSPALHAKLWEAIMRSRERSQTEKRAALDADVASLLRVRGAVPAAMHAVAYAYDDLSPETSKRLRAQILDRFPNSPEADWVRIREIRGLSRARDQAKQQGATPNAATDQALRTALDSFIARSHHAIPALVGEAYFLRYFLVKEDEDSSPETLLAAARGLAAYERNNLHLFADAAAVLAERTPYRADAEAIVREGLQLAEQQLARASPSEGMSARANNLQSILLCGLGTVLRTQGRFGEARSALVQAHTLTQGRLIEPLLGLAALAEAEGQPSAAEGHLLEALTIDSKTEKVEVALKELYRRRRGGERGFEKYRAGVELSLREQRKAAVLATRLKDANLLTPFTLPRLAGGDMQSGSLAGRVTVINLWATFCRPCIDELPALQQLAGAFTGAADVAILTVNTDPETDQLASWMTEHGYHFEVLLGERWSVEAGYRSLPTTLFIDQHGRIAFIKIGATDRLVEEFTWRIEALRSKPRRERKTVVSAH